MEIFLCGGTIDKHYDPVSETFVFSDTHIYEMLHQARLAKHPKVTKLFLKDSLDISDTDSSELIRCCRQTMETKILVVHGTSRMVELASKCWNQTKTIVFFGSMLPFNVSDSDAMFNFGTAIMACNLKAPGVYITMNGLCLDVKEAKKDVKTATFHKVESKCK